jgi:poly(3-hydroxybutyrate) depolymerase
MKNTSPATKALTLTVIFIVFLSSRSFAQAKPSTGPELKTASGKLMQYYVSLPVNWKPDKKWPIVVVAEAAEKEFKENAQRFINARGQMPFIIIAPVIVTNGNYGRRDPAVYPYVSATLDKIEAMGDCEFDMSGVLQAVNDVKKNYNGEDQFFITGFEAGTHLVWAMVFQHPELLRAAAPVAGNYIGRCMDNAPFSSHPAKSGLPVKGFTGQGGRAYYQYQNAKKAAQAHGYKNVSETVVPGKAHVPLPQEVLVYFFSVIKGRGN